jgi:hypothetical protein
MYRLNVLGTRNPKQQYKLLGDFLRRSMFNRSTYEAYIPNCPIILAMTSVYHPEDWRAMLFATLKYPRPTMPYPYVCFISVMEADRRFRLGSLLMHQFIQLMVMNDMQTNAQNNDVSSI